MASEITDSHLADFKDGVKGLLQLEVGIAIPDGLCYSLYGLTNTLSSSYGVMGAVLTVVEYAYGLSERGLLTLERYQFLIFLDCLSIEDLRDFVEGHYSK